LNPPGKLPNPSSNAPRPAPRADRSFYASGKAFGRFGIRSFQPEVMAEPHSHGHIELNWLTQGSIDYRFDGRPASVPAGRLVAFWAGIPHQAIGLSPDAGRQVNIYLPMDAFLHMPQLGRLTETLMGGGVIQLPADAASLDMVDRWHQDYRSGNAARTDIVMTELGTMFRRSALMGWNALLPPWIETSTTDKRSASPVHYVVQMVRHIVENIAEPLSTQAVAEVVGLHPNYASNLFTKVMRIPMQKFVVRMRLIKARALLFEGRLSIANIGYQSGFASLSQFYEHFRQAYGTTPSQMRNSINTL